MWDTLTGLINAPLAEEDAEGRQRAQAISQLPMRLGGLGLRSAVRTAPAAYWASWADALPMLRARVPVVALAAVRSLTANNGDMDGCIREANAARELLVPAGFVAALVRQQLFGGKAEQRG